MQVISIAELTSIALSNLDLKMGSTQASLLGLLKILMILICAGWVSLWLLKPTDLWTKKWKVAENRARNTVIGSYGKKSSFFTSTFITWSFHFYARSFPCSAGLNFAVFTFPIIAVAIIGLIYLNVQLKVARIR